MKFVTSDTKTLYKNLFFLWPKIKKNGGTKELKTQARPSSCTKHEKLVDFNFDFLLQCGTKIKWKNISYVVNFHSLSIERQKSFHKKICKRVFGERKCVNMVGFQGMLVFQIIIFKQ